MKDSLKSVPSRTESDAATRAGLYIHVPFCTSVCPYCDFAVTIAGDQRRAAWVDGIIREAGLYADCGLKFDTVYLGGGTPSSVDPPALHRILDGLRRHLAIKDGAMVFLEANSEDVTISIASAWRGLGVDFVSLGVQSFDDRVLEFLGRRHTGDQARAAVETLLGGGFDTVSLDLIYGFEGQTTDSWCKELELATSLGAQHLSCYQLTFHEGTVFGRRLAEGAMAESSEGLQAELFFLTHERLADAGYQGYEVSNFAQFPRHRSRHNMKYWEHVPYLGLGPSAHSFVDTRRWWNRRKLRLWQRAIDSGLVAEEEMERPSPSQLALEALMLGLRTADGVEIDRFQNLFGVDLAAANAAAIDGLCESGHLRVVDGCLRPTLAGLAVADTLARAFEVSVTDERRRTTVR